MKIAVATTIALAAAQKNEKKVRQRFKNFEKKIESKIDIFTRKLNFHWNLSRNSKGSDLK